MFHAFTALGCSLLCVYIEFFVPGAIFGTIGGMIYLISIIIAFTQANDLLYFVLFLLFAFLGLFLTVRLALWQIKGKNKDHAMYLNQDQEGFRASEYCKEVIGKNGIALCDLRPGGYIMIEERRYKAIAESGYITKGSSVQVTSGQGADLIVKFLM